RWPPSCHPPTTPTVSSVAPLIGTPRKLIVTRLIRYRELPRYDRARARQQSEPCTIADPCQNADEDRELEAVGRSCLRQHLPQYPEHRLGDAHGPDRPTKAARLVSFTLRRPLDGRRLATSASHPDRSRSRQVRGLGQ